MENKDITTQAQVTTGSNIELKEVIAEPKIEKPEGLTRRDALEIAIKARAPQEGTRGNPKVVSVDKEEGVQAEASSDIQPDEQEQNDTATNPPLSPPAEYTPEERADFMQLSRKGQEAQLRLDKSRKSTMTDVNNKLQELSYLKKLDEDVKPFLKAMGVKESTPVAMQKAIAMWKEFEYAEDPYAAAAEYLKAKGRDVPEEWSNNASSQSSKNIPSHEITALQEKVNTLESYLAAENQAKLEVSLNQVWQDFATAKNSAGLPKFPDALDDSEAGMRLAAEIGSLVSGKTELSKDFINRTKNRIPDCTPTKLIEAAYKYCEGRVDDTPSTKYQKTEQSKKSHVSNSLRAASSTPGGATQSATSTVKKFSSRKEALAQALADYYETHN